MDVRVSGLDPVSALDRLHTPRPPGPDVLPAPPGAQPVRDPGPEAEPVGPRQVELAVEQLNRMIATFSADLRFVLHQASGRMMVRVIDSQSGEVLREHPPEKVLDTLVAIREAVGMLLDKQI